MKNNRILFLLVWLIILPGINGCNAEKQMAERRNLMIPHRDELPRNSKYRGIKKRKTKKRNKKRRACVDFFSKEQIQQA